MKTIFLGVIIIMTSITCYAQKVITDCTISYTVNATKKNANTEPGAIDLYNGTTINLYVKANNSRMETTTPMGNVTFIYDSKTETAVRLRESGANKFIEKISKEKLDAENKKFEGATFKDGTTTKQIAGYNCKEGTVTLQSGTIIKVFYTTDIQPQNKKFDFQFDLVPGFVLEYTRETADAVIVHTATKCSLSPVPQSKFEAPKSGYRELK
jgi:GLPGLI family protein